MSRYEPHRPRPRSDDYDDELPVNDAEAEALELSRKIDALKASSWRRRTPEHDDE